MLIFFAVSGTWQELPHHYWNNNVLALLSTIHEADGLKSHPSTLSSRFLVVFVLLMAASLVVNIILGIVMAFRFGHQRLAVGSLLAGTAVPLLLIIIFAR
jgi:hypothetical protein